MKELIEQISAKADAFLKDAASQLEKGNKAAGLRADFRPAALRSNWNRSLSSFAKPL